MNVCVLVHPLPAVDVPYFVALEAGEQHADGAAALDVAGHGAEDRQGRRAPRREEIQLVLGHARGAPIQIFDAEPQPIGDRRAVVDAGLAAQPPRDVGVRAPAGEAGLESEVLHEHGARRRVVARRDRAERQHRRAAVPADEIVVELAQGVGDQRPVSRERSDGANGSPGLESGLTRADHQTLIIDLEERRDLRVAHDKVLVVAVHALTDGIGLGTVVVPRLQGRPGESEEQREAVGHEDAIPMHAVHQPFHERARRHAVQAPVDEAEAAAEEVRALVEPARAELRVPHALHHPVLAALHRRAVEDEHITRRAIDRGEPGEARQPCDFAVAQAERRGAGRHRVGRRRGSSSAARRTTACRA